MESQKQQAATAEDYALAATLKTRLGQLQGQLQAAGAGADAAAPTQMVAPAADVSATRAVSPSLGTLEAEMVAVVSRKQQARRPSSCSIVSTTCHRKQQILVVRNRSNRPD